MNITTIPAGRSPYEARLNNKRKGTRSLTQLRYPDQKAPNKSVGESEVRIALVHPEKRFKFKFNKGKHVKPAGGSMRAKGARRSRHSNYVRPAIYAHAKLSQLLDRPKQPLSNAVASAPDQAPKQHFGILDRLRSMSPF
jgi:hypothetical protein